MHFCMPSSELYVYLASVDMQEFPPPYQHVECFLTSRLMVVTGLSVETRRILRRFRCGFGHVTCTGANCTERCNCTNYACICHVCRAVFSRSARPVSGWVQRGRRVLKATYGVGCNSNVVNANAKLDGVILNRYVVAA